MSWKTIEGKQRDSARIAVKRRHSDGNLCLAVRLHPDIVPDNFALGARVEVALGTDEHAGLLRLRRAEKAGYKLRKTQKSVAWIVTAACPAAYASRETAGQDVEIAATSDDEIVLVLPNTAAPAAVPTPAGQAPGALAPAAPKPAVSQPAAKTQKPPAAPAPTAPAPVKSAASAGSYAIDSRLFEPLLDTIDAFAPHDAVVRRVRATIATARNRAGKAATVSVYLERVDVGCLAVYAAAAAKNMRFDQRVQDLAKGLLERLGGVS